MFDPLFENPFSHNGFSYPDARFDKDAIRRLKVDAIFISHYHDDHCSFESLDLLNRDTKVFMYCVHAEMFSLLQRLGFNNVFSLKLGEVVRVGDIEVITHLALDPDVDAVFHIRTGSVNILNAVDSWIDPEAFEVLKKTNWDLVIWPFQTMREIEVLCPQQAAPFEGYPPELLEQLKGLKPKAIVPGSCQFIHEPWSWYRDAYFPMSYQQFAKEVKVILPGAKVIRVNPGESLLLNHNITEAKRLDWIQPIGVQEVDYYYDPRASVPSTSEITKKFPELSSAKMEELERFCKVGLIQKFNNLDQASETYLNKKNLKWELRLFSANGEAQSFLYKLNNSKLSITESASDIGWRTDVIAFKLISALQEGESLSSIYLRINDGITGEALQADVMQDPLIRTLYEGEFAAYQKAQLKKLGR